MTKQEAADVLGVSSAAGLDEVRNRYQEMYSDYQIRLTNAPTHALKRTYQQNLEGMRAAVRVLFPGIEVSTLSENFPASEPTFVNEVASSNVSSPTSQKRPPAVQQTAHGEKPKNSSRGLITAIIACALLGAAAFFFLSLWMQSRDSLGDLDRFIGASPTDQLSFLEKPQYKSVGQSLRQGLQMQRNGKLAICNDFPDSIKITWLSATYFGEDGRFITFNSMKYHWPTWTTKSGNGQKIPLTYQEQNSAASIWDGAVVFYAFEVEHNGDQYDYSGIWEFPVDGCIHLKEN
jgi:hypothetical protein